MRRLLFFALLLVAAVGQAQYTVAEYPNIVYTQASGFPQRLDLYLPNALNVPRRPGLVFVHGGGWAGGDKSAYTNMARLYASKGYVCVSINYRLTPQHVWPAQIDDTQAAVRWMRKNAGFLSLNPKKIGAIGGSAGGHLVLFLGSMETLNDFDPALSGVSSRVQAVVDYFGPTDMMLPQEWSPSVWPLVIALVGQPWYPESPAYQNVSPFYFVDATDAPTLMFHGTADATVPVDQSRRMKTKMQLIGQPVQYHEFAGQGHGFNASVSSTCLGLIDVFFRQRLLN